MKHPGVVLTVSLFLLFLSSNSCTKEKAGTKERTHVQAKSPVEKTAAPDTEASQLGDELFEKHCKVCHGADGKGDIGPSLIDKEWKYGGSDDDLYYSIAKGRSSGMPNWDHTLNEENIRLIIEYIRSIGEE